MSHEPVVFDHASPLTISHVLSLSLYIYIHMSNLIYNMSRKIIRPYYPLFSCHWFFLEGLHVHFKRVPACLAGTPSGRLVPWTAPVMDDCISLSFWVP